MTIDSTGAGDAFNAGVLCGIMGGNDLGSSVRMGHKTARTVIKQIGARPSLP
jgi:sugar/nucleoside kinase (ribokinase family)